MSISEKSLGPGNIPPELLKYETENLFKYLVKLLQNYINKMNPRGVENIYQHYI